MTGGPGARLRRRLPGRLRARLAAWRRPSPPPEALARLHAAPMPAPMPVPERGLRVFHLGHSLVGRDMPAMLAQLAAAAGLEGHGYESQIGWGTPLEAHWEPDLPIEGFERENAHPRFRPAEAALASGDYDAVVLTEMVEIRAAIAYHDAWDYLARWAARAWAGNPRARVFLYETWHRTDDPEGFLARIDRDLTAHWLGEILGPALAAPALAGRAIDLVPAGQALARVLRAVEAAGGVDGIRAPEDLLPDGIHPNDAGVYLVALTHFAALYGRSPEGLPHALHRADGRPAEAPGPAAARLMQASAWAAVRALRPAPPGL